MSDSGSPSRPWEWIALINAAKQSKRYLPALLLSFSLSLINREGGKREREGGRESRDSMVVLRFFSSNKPTWIGEGREAMVENSAYRRYGGWKSEAYLRRMVVHRLKSKSVAFVREHEFKRGRGKPRCRLPRCRMGEEFR